MSATDVKATKLDQSLNTKLPTHQINPSYTVRVICCVLFIFLTEICLAHYVYRLINSEIRSEYVPKSDFGQFVRNEIRSDYFREEVTRVLKDYESNKKSVQVREKRSVGSGGELNFLNSQNEEPLVEFFDPKNRGYLEEKDEEIRRQTGKGSAPGGDSWIWVTSSSRIPERALEGYCKRVQEFCPPPKTGPQGPQGLKGETGERGLPGLHGPPGIPGYPGTKGEPGKSGMDGFPGEKGEQGRPGLDGRDGIPGEPGLFGMPGRNGQDGIPGTDGLPGRAGKDGVNGLKGDKGSPGPQGPPGQRGLTGPRGRPGKPGNHGTPGIPGITAWTTFSKYNVSEYLIAPSIAGVHGGPVGPIIVREQENVRLHCSATGTPRPRITWMRLDNRPINRGAWEDVQVAGETLNLTRVHRDHMGTYMCIADNGVPPQANQTFILEVHFPPLIRISNQMVGVANGSTAVLECETEAFPEPLRYWERSDGRLLENGDKYRIDNSIEKNGYRSRMQLSISRMTAYDLTFLYQCVSKNELQTTRGEFTLYELDPRQPPPRFKNKEITFGPSSPDKVSEEDLCGPPIRCPECETKEVQKCSPTGVDWGVWEVRQYGEGKYHYPGWANRATDCVLYAIGKPVYNRYSDHNYGCWMKDSNPHTESDSDKFWVTDEDHPGILFEYSNKTSFRKDAYSKQYHLKYSFNGNGHVIYNGSFFYHAKDSRRIMRYRLEDEKDASYDLPVPANYTVKLYSGQYNTVDFSVDDNGLWLIFGVPESNNTAVVKLDAEQMRAQYIWNISINHQKVGEMFIVCGVLYAVDSVSDRNTKVRFALDLYKNILLDVNLSFSNPFRKTTMLGYNHKNKELYSWDRGNQLTYPVRYHEIGYNISAKDEKALENQDNPSALRQTGYTVY